MRNRKEHKIIIRFTEEQMALLLRESEQRDVSIAQIIRTLVN